MPLEERCEQLSIIDSNHKFVDANGPGSVRPPKDILRQPSSMVRQSYRCRIERILENAPAWLFRSCHTGRFGIA